MMPSVIRVQRQEIIRAIEGKQEKLPLFICSFIHCCQSFCWSPVWQAEHRKIRTPPSSDRVYNLLGFKEKITLTMDLKNQQYSDRCGLRKGGSKWKETEQRYVEHGCWGRGEVFSSFTQENRVMQLEKRVEFCRLLSLIPSFYRRGSRAQRS